MMIISSIGKIESIYIINSISYSVLVVSSYLSNGRINTSTASSAIKIDTSNNSVYFL